MTALEHSNRRDATAAIERSRMIVIVRLQDPDDEIARALLDAGVKVVELSLASQGALDVLTRWRASFPELVIGAGTVLDAYDCERAIEAGAEFLISPGFSGEVSEIARSAGVPYVPGALTPTEIQRCLAAGSSLVKLFPAAPVGVGYLEALLGPFPGLRLVPTGGVDCSNAAAFLQAGAAAVAVGSSIVRRGSTHRTVAEAASKILNAIDATHQGERRHAG